MQRSKCEINSERQSTVHERWILARWSRNARRVIRNSVITIVISRRAMSGCARALKRVFNPCLVRVGRRNIRDPYQFTSDESKRARSLPIISFSLSPRFEAPAYSLFPRLSCVPRIRSREANPLSLYCSTKLNK